MSIEFTPSSLTESTPEELKVKLYQPAVIAMLKEHMRSYAISGILRAYDNALGCEEQPTDKDLLRLVWPELTSDRIDSLRDRQMQEYLATIKTRGIEAPLLVGVYPTDTNFDNTYENKGPHYDWYFIEKINAGNGESIPESQVKVGMIESGLNDVNRLLPENGFSKKQMKIILRNFQEQVEVGIVYKGQFPIFE